MNEFERKLAEHGFTDKENRVLRSYTLSPGDTYSSLLKELASRFISSLVPLVVILIALVFNVLYDDTVSVISYFLTLIVALPVFYVFTPEKIGFKAFSFRLKKII